MISAQLPRLMIDPSLALRTETLSWLGSPGVIGSIAVSRTFVRALEAGNPSISGFVRRPNRETSISLLSVLEPAEKFSHEDARDLDPLARLVLEQLVVEAKPTTEILADEWAFLNSRSWVAARTKFAFDAFHRAGAHMTVLARRSMRLLVARTLKIPGNELPAVITGAMLRRTGLKWLAAGVTPFVGSVLTPPLGPAISASGSMFLLFDP